MDKPPFDPLAEYLEAHAILTSLHLERAKLEKSGDGMGQDQQVDAEDTEIDQGTKADLAILLKRLGAGIEETEALLTTYEEYLEQKMCFLADQADAGRLLFARVSARIAEIQELLNESAQLEQTYRVEERDGAFEASEHPSAWGPEDQQEWEALLSDFERIRSHWIKWLPLEDGMGSD